MLFCISRVGLLLFYYWQMSTKLTSMAEGKPVWNKCDSFRFYFLLLLLLVWYGTPMVQRSDNKILVPRKKIFVPNNASQKRHEIFSFRIEDENDEMIHFVCSSIIHLLDRKTCTKTYHAGSLTPLFVVDDGGCCCTLWQRTPQICRQKQVATNTSWSSRANQSTSVFGLWKPNSWWRKGPIGAPQAWDWSD